jgi:hypothetical protein
VDRDASRSHFFNMGVFSQKPCTWHEVFVLVHLAAKRRFLRQNGHRGSMALPVRRLLALAKQSLRSTDDRSGPVKFENVSAI